jgi:uncharacterized integral membrane protein
MSPSLMHWVKLIGGVILLLLGLVWALQGVDVLGGSGMSGQSQWLFIGAVVGIFGLWLIYGSLRRGAPR